VNASPSLRGPRPPLPTLQEFLAADPRRADGVEHNLGDLWRAAGEDPLDVSERAEAADDVDVPGAAPETLRDPAVRLLEKDPDEPELEQGLPQG
jgi:hypothetical protein